MLAKDHQRLPHPDDKLSKTQKAELISRIEQVAQLSADARGYRDRLFAANAERESLRARVKVLEEALQGLVSGFDGETDCTDLLDMIDGPARAALKE